MSNPYRAEYEIDTGEGVVKMRFNHAALEEIEERIGMDPIEFYNSKLPTPENPKGAQISMKHMRIIFAAGMRGAELDDTEQRAGLAKIGNLPLVEARAHAFVALGRGLVRPEKPGDAEKNGDSAAPETPANPAAETAPA